MRMNNQTKYFSQCALDNDLHHATYKTNKTRWNFDELNLERKQLDKFARRAFDPSNSFSSYHFNDYNDDQEKTVSFISRPHQYETSQISIPPKNTGTYTKPKSNKQPYKQIEVPTKPFKPRNPNISPSISTALQVKPLKQKKKFDIDSAIDGFVDDIEEYSQW